MTPAHTPYPRFIFRGTHRELVEVAETLEAAGYAWRGDPPEKLPSNTLSINVLRNRVLTYVIGSTTLQRFIAKGCPVVPASDVREVLPFIPLFLEP